ncbi:hypothetical protein [Aeromonas rivipollensis]|uniref:hypothetical protein n=1 Tax=Aeromonas rivipollensis TaxID=948519 RepID=UPI003D1E0F71
MFLIMSAAYVGQELASEFGKIPPSFLPLGNKRLFQHQIKLAPSCADVFLSIPSSFSVSATDMAWLKSNNVTLLSTPDDLSIGASVVAALNLSGCVLDKSLSILYGDTLYSEIPLDDDVLSVSENQDNYNWGVFKANSLKINEEQESIIDGYFKVSNPRELIKGIVNSKWDFLEGLNYYHEVIGLKPRLSKGWLDFGHVNTYFRSKAKFTTQRAFNELVITPSFIEKSSSNNKKIAAESNWFKNIPQQLRGYIPQYLGENQSDNRISYQLEYLYLSAVNELFVFSKLPLSVWRQILSSCLEFLSLCRMHKNKGSITSERNDLNNLFYNKTKQRLNDFCIHNKITLEQEWQYNNSHKVSLSSVLADCNIYLPSDAIEETVLHGDFCFSNILYDFRSGRIKVIDPRGMTPSGENTIYGDIRYDIAKLSHSIIGLYDLIISGNYVVNIEKENISFEIMDEDIHSEIQIIFFDLVKKQFGLSAENIYAMQIHLFLSMLPLHFDDKIRQKALFSNVFRLHQKLVRSDE